MNENKYFKKWEDALPYIGKKIRVHLVEYPDVIGYLTAVRVAMSGDEILNGFLEVDDTRGAWEYWKCSPLEEIKPIDSPVKLSWLDILSLTFIVAVTISSAALLINIIYGILKEII